jgi:hypothetical protein
MTEARSIEEAGADVPLATEDVAHVRPAVERWLTWSGLIPLPAFLVLHLLRELSLSFATDIADVERAAPSWFARVSAILLIWVPLAVHVALATLRWLPLRKAEPVAANAGVDVDALPQRVSRLTSWLALLFLIHHGSSYALPIWRGEAAAEDAGFRLLAELSSTTWGVPVHGGAYLLGLLVTITHAALGVHRGLLREGLLRSAARRRRSARACVVLGAAAFGVGAAAVIRVASGVLLR